MGVIWIATPLDTETKKWLSSMDIVYPDAASRLPTGTEIKAVLKELSGCSVEIDDNGIGANWQAMITRKSGGDAGQWANLDISEYSGDDEAQELCFRKGSEELIKDILKKLSATCGPLVLINDTGETPTVITASLATG